MTRKPFNSRFAKKAAVALFCTLITHGARADIDCEGTLNSVLVYTGGMLVINPSWRGDYIKLCVMSGTPTEIATCAAWVAIAKEAIRSAKSVFAYYYDSTGALTCANLPTYSATPVPAYFALRP
jgi:hypothetical protein